MRCQGSGAGSIQLLNGVDRRFSLYSTDTEERLISVDKGLDRCTAMLRSLLQIEDPVPGGRQLPMSKEKTTFTSRKGRTFRDKPTKQLGSMKEENRLQANPDHKKKWEHGPSKLQDKSADCNPLVVHPEACSTPDGKGGARHTAERAKERQKISALQSAPAVIVRQEHTVAPSHIRRAETKVNQKVDLSTNKTCRRLESDQRQTPSTARDAIPSLARKANDCGPQRNILWIGKDKKMVTKTEKNSADRPVAPLHHQQQASVACGDGSSPPPPPPPLFNPFYYPYGFPYLPPYPYPYFHHPHFHHPQSWTPYKHSSGTKRHQVVPHKADVMEALDLASIHYQPLHRHHRSREEPLDYYHWYFDHRYHQHLSSPKCSTHDKQSGVVEEKQDPPPPMEPATIATNGTGTEITVKSVPVLACEEISDLEGLGGLVKILMSSCEETVQNMKMACGEEPVMVRLTELQVVLSQMRQRLCEQCQRMSLKHKQEQLSKMSVADWLGQVQLCEDEKAGLIERIKESCGAYSKVRKKLDDLQEEKQMQDRELEEKKKQVSSLQEELGKASGSVRQMAAKLKLKHEELVHVKGCSHSSGKELQAQNTAFQEQLSSLKVEVREGTEQQLGLMRELSHVRQVLDANKAEQQMLQVTMQGKSTQLLETQDKLLGLRQCLACFLSGLSRTGTVEQEQGVATRGHFLQYVVPVQVVEKLKLLADDGNIES